MEVLTESSAGEASTFAPAPSEADGEALARGMERLVSVVLELSLARDLPSVMSIVRRAARELTGADGATFVLREGDLVHYADEDAVSPLWKGQRFPMTACISGWVILNRRPAEIEDIYADPRVPQDAYRPTFVRSLVMIPIRAVDPIGAIGNYWSEPRKPRPHEVKLLQALADITSVTMENVRVHAELEQRVEQRTRELSRRTEQLRSMTVRLAEVETRERGRLSVFLHDKIQQNLVAIRLKIDSMAGRAPSAPPDELQSMAGEVGGLIRGAIESIRDLTAELSPAIVEDAGLRSALVWLVRRFREKRGLETKLDIALAPGAEEALAPARTFIFEAARELLSNVRKHSGKLEAELKLRVDEGRLELEALDGGFGIDPASWLNGSGAGVGLIQLRERVESLGGELLLLPRPEGGARVALHLPLVAISPSAPPLAEGSDPLMQT